MSAQTASAALPSPANRPQNHLITHFKDSITAIPVNPDVYGLHRGLIRRRALHLLKPTILLLGLLFGPSSWGAGQSEIDPAEIAIGERLFQETRFAQAYYASPGVADLALQETITTTEPLPGPFAGQTINCRACHLVDEHKAAPHGGMRTYADFAHHSPIPDRGDGNHRTTRNSMSLVNIALPGKHGELFHFDGEFNSMEDLVRATLTGRNYGWQAGELQTAMKHIATIIRNDDGKGVLAQEFGGSYAKVLTGTSKEIPDAFRLPSAYRINVKTASDQQILDAIARLISAYVNDLAFAKDSADNYNGSPYDYFLQKTNLPRKPADNENLSTYSQRLLSAINNLTTPKFVSEKDNKFKYHSQAFVFGKNELQGMKLFFSKGSKKRSGGNCISCHTAPHFSDFGFHNTGLTQSTYDENHGTGAFNKLSIPDLAMRNKDYSRYLPATGMHPKASSRFRSAVNIDKPGYADLGLWNIFANPDMPAPQQKLNKLMCDQAKLHGHKQCDKNKLLPFAIASFKTPVLRDLGHSAPYMHNGKFTALKDAVSFYISSSQLARNGALRNADVKLKDIHISAADVNNLVAFLKSLNEDYD